MKSLHSIELVYGSGEGTTELGAFDATLVACGIGNYNLIRLSSVIPPRTNVLISQKWAEPAHDWGNRLYLVYAYASVSIPGEQAWAGIGWVVLDEHDAGLFVEHEAESEQECKELIEQSLSDLCISRGLNPSDYTFQSLIKGITCNKVPVGIIVAAVYCAEQWPWVPENEAKNELS